jgi:hypothetical protein
MSPLSVTIKLSAIADGKYQITAQTASGDEQSAVTRNPFTTREVENYLEILSRHKHNITPLEQAKAARQFGAKLFNFLIKDRPEIYSLYITLAQRGLRVRLSLDNAGQLASFPWELLRDPEGDFLALSESTSIVRVPHQLEERTPVPLLLPLRILVAVAGRAAEESWRHLEIATAEMRRVGHIVLERLRYASLDELRLQILAEDHHVFHYIGFARSDNQAEQPFLVMRHKDRGFIRADEMNEELYPESTVRLVMLTPCKHLFQPMGNFATRLHLTAVATMQFPLSRVASIVFFREFYGALAQGVPVDVAMSQARRTIANGLQNSEWASPILFAGSQDGMLFRRVSSYRAGAKRG